MKELEIKEKNSETKTEQPGTPEWTNTTDNTLREIEGEKEGNFKNQKEI